MTMSFCTIEMSLLVMYSFIFLVLYVWDWLLHEGDLKLYHAMLSEMS
jgi:hypothetical protein